MLQVVLRAAKFRDRCAVRTIDNAVKYVKTVTMPAQAGSVISRFFTGICPNGSGIYSLQVYGLYDDPLVMKGSSTCSPTTGNLRSGMCMAISTRLAQYMIGGDTWEKWYKAIATTVVKSIKKKRYLPLGRQWRRVANHHSRYTTMLAILTTICHFYQR